MSGALRVRGWQSRPDTLAVRQSGQQRLPIISRGLGHGVRLQAVDVDVADSVAAAADTVPEVVAPVVKTTYKLTAPSIANYPSGNTSVPAPKSEAVSIDLPDLSGASDAAAKTAAEAQAAAARAAEEASKALNDVGASISGLGSGITDSVSSLGSGITGGLSSLTNTAGSATSEATQAVSAALGGVLSEVNSAASVAGSAINAATGTISDSTQALVSTVDAATSGVTSSISATYQAVETGVTGTVSQVWGAIPPEGQALALQAVDLAKAAAEQVKENPVEASIVIGAVVVPTFLLSYSSKFGGYAGELSPALARDLLVEQKLVLVDVREEGMREREGLPELKLGARFQAVELPLSVAAAVHPDRVLRQAGSKDTLVIQTAAALIAGLKQVKSPLMKVMIMDSKGNSNTAKDLARALRAEGVYQSYVMQGGFQQWVSDGLPVVQGAVEYEANTAAFLGDQVELVTKQVGSAAATLREPTVGLPVAAGAVVGGFALINYHLTLEYIGVLGMMWSLVSGDAYRTFGGAIEGVKKLASKQAEASAKKSEQAKRVAATVASRPAPSNGAPPLVNAASEVMAVTSPSVKVKTQPPSERGSDAVKVSK